MSEAKISEAVAREMLVNEYQKLGIEAQSASLMKQGHQPGGVHYAAVQAIVAALHLHPQPAELAEQQGVFQEHSTHHVYRGSCGSLPCYCWATDDHVIGDEVKRFAATGKQQVGEVQGDGHDFGAMTDLLGRWQRNAAITPSPNPVAKARREVWVQCLSELQAALAARQPGELIAQKVGDYRVTVAEETITVSHGRDIVFAYSAGDAEPIMVRQSGAQLPVAFAVESPAFETHAKLAGLNMEQHPLHYLFLDPKTYAARQAWKAALKFAPPAQGIDLGQFREAVQEAYENADGGTLNKFSLEELLALIDQRDAAPGVE